MKTLKVYWKKELKNCVPFFIFVNGKECGIIQRGEVREVDIENENVELYFVPKAPKFFGWKALKINTQIYGDAPEIHLGVEVNNYAPTALSRAANFENQLHCINLMGMDIAKAEYIKNYR